MTAEPNTTPSLDLAQAIAQAADAAHLPKAERMKAHRKAIQAIAFRHGMEGVNRYKDEYPEAKPIRLWGAAIAFFHKPVGYDASLVSMALHWLDSPTALAMTNAADVARLNEKLGTNYPPAKHFSESLNQSRLQKIRAAYAERGVPLGAAVKTMAHVRKAAKAATGATKAETRFSSVGVISGDALIINGRSQPIETNGQRRCIRPTINGKRSRLYLDELEWVADWLGGAAADPLEDTNTISIIRELPYPTPPVENGGQEPGSISDSPYSAASFEAWFAANNIPLPQPRAIPEGEGVDPLEFIDL